MWAHFRSTTPAFEANARRSWRGRPLGQRRCCSTTGNSGAARGVAGLGRQAQRRARGSHRPEHSNEDPAARQGLVLEVLLPGSCCAMEQVTRDCFGGVGGGPRRDRFRQHGTRHARGVPQRNSRTSASRRRIALSSFRMSASGMSAGELVMARRGLPTRSRLAGLPESANAVLCPALCESVWPPPWARRS